MLVIFHWFLPVTLFFQLPNLHLFLSYCHELVQHIVTRLQAGMQMNCGLLPHSGKRLSSSPKYQDWDSPRFLPTSYWGSLSPTSKTDVLCSWHHSSMFCAEIMNGWICNSTSTNAVMVYTGTALPYLSFSMLFLHFFNLRFCFSVSPFACIFLSPSFTQERNKKETRIFTCMVKQI